MFLLKIFEYSLLTCHTKTWLAYLEILSKVALTHLLRYFNTSESFQLLKNDTGIVISAAKRCLDRIYNESERYKKCGVLLLDLIPESTVIPDLFLRSSHPERNAFMKAADAINIANVALLFVRNPI
ncbi:hypothetical protein [Candidatus Protochlamydia naegleriophila]|uniref:DinB/UmuC family translesion DNA polymerase n=1 Tax=Candidatus Protochlamydia naegleriophila TaxID=389348 RepID=UPI00073E15AE